MTKSRNIMPPRAHWSAEHLAILRERYPNEKASVIAADLGRPVYSIYGKAAQLNLKKTAEFMADPTLSGRADGTRGESGRIQKGSTPWNKGMKGLHYTASVPTQFKPGSKPHNTQPIGSYRHDKDGTLQRKISDAGGNNSKRWRGVHELVWVEANGPLPPKHIVVFKPGMRTTVLEEITIDKVECISLAENMKRNTRHNLPKEINEVIHLRAVLTRHINKRSKSNERTEENH